MEDYWRMCMGTSNTQNLPHPKSIAFDDLDADDFSDVFGGPPRTVLCRKYSGDFTEWASFYDEAFRPLQFSYCHSLKGGRSLPSFNIPARGEGLDDDVFRSSDDLRRSSCERPKSDSFSLRSWDKLSHLRPTAGDDIGLAPNFRWKSTTMVSDQEQISPFPNTVSFNDENLHMENELEKLMKNSPFSGNLMTEYEDKDDDDDDDEDEVTSSYVIEINSDFTQSTTEAVSIDDAIAWAKERCNAPKSPLVNDDTTLLIEHICSCLTLTPEFEQHETNIYPYNYQSQQDKPQSKDEDVMHWASGNENNIRMLLSTLHKILWPDSGWNMTDITSLAETSQVKKAYQKARLCLHPDKLQQRGATLPQKYIAEKAFSILQDAWDAFSSQDVFFNQMTMQGILESFWEAWNKQGVQGFEGLRTVLKT